MTLAQNAACCAHLKVVYRTEPAPGINVRGEPTMDGTRGWWECELCQTPFSPRLALLAEWSAGEGLEAAVKAAIVGSDELFVEYDYGRLSDGGMCRGIVALAAPLIRAPLVAEVETLRGERDRQYEENVGQIARYAALEARVQRLEIGLKNFLAVCDDLDSKTGKPSVHGVYCLERRRVEGLRTLLPEETTITITDDTVAAP